MTNQDDEVAYKAGDVLAEKYQVERVLGIGGFGAVLCARHMQLDDRVAIKVLLPHAAKNPAAAERFLREAKAAVRIRSEHVAKVTDVGQLADTTPFMVMEYLDGEDLSTLVKTQGMQPVADVAEWVIQACEAIAEAHSLGIIHRDLKPANLFRTYKVDRTPCIKVLDFGISKLTDSGGDKGMTKTSDVMGSPFYMSPEQMRSTRNVDRRADIWALGAILFELLAGAPPFDAETMTALVVSIMQEPPRQLGDYRKDVPLQMQQIIMKCLEKNPDARYPDVASLAAALSPFAASRAGASMARIMAISGRPSAPPTSGPPTAVSGPPTMVDGTPHGHISGGHISGGHISGGHISGSPISGGHISGSRSPALTMEGGPLSIAQRSATPLAQTAASPAQSWGATYSGKRSSRMPVIVGTSALMVGALAVAGFIVLKKPSSTGDESKKASGALVHNSEAASTSTAIAASTVETTVQPVDDTTGSTSTARPGVTPIPGAGAPRPGGRPTAPPAVTTAVVISTPAPPAPTGPPPGPVAPPPKPPVQVDPPPVVKPPPGPFDRPD